MTGEQLLVDTNIFVYAYDRSERAKQIRSQEVLDRLVEAGNGAISTQVLGEFFWAVTRKLAKRLSPQEGYLQLREFVRSWKVLMLTPEIILESARGVGDYQFPFYDAQLWATAKAYQIHSIVTEDFQHQSRVEGVQFLNPFLARLPGEQ